MKKLSLIAAALLLLLATSARADIKGDLAKVGVTADGANLWMNGWFRSKVQVIVYNTTTTARIITAREAHGAVFVMASTSDDPASFDLPAAVKGMHVFFIDNDATAAADLTVNPDDDDKINNQSAGVSYNATGDAYGELIELVAVSSTEWVVFRKIGTWTTGS